MTRTFKGDIPVLTDMQIVYSVETALAYSVGAYWLGLANNGMNDEQRQLLNPKSKEYRLRLVKNGHIKRCYLC